MYIYSYAHNIGQDIYATTKFFQMLLKLKITYAVGGTKYTAMSKHIKFNKLHNRS